MFLEISPERETGDWSGPDPMELTAGTRKAMMTRFVNNTFQALEDI